MKTNKKLKDLARKSALTYKMNENSLTVVENFTLKSIKTKDYIKILNSFFGRLL